MKVISAILSIKSLIVIFIIFLIVGLVQNFFYLDPSNGCLIHLTPSVTLNNGKIHKALDLLKLASPQDYNDVCSQVTTIDPNLSCGTFDSSCFSGTAGQIVVNTADATLAVVAQTIVLETCHAKQFADKKEQLNPECYQKSYTTLNNLTAY